jgi:cytochrome c peroxidase
MSVEPNASLLSSARAAQSAGAGYAKGFVRKRALQAAALSVLGLLAASVYALVHPERMPNAIGELVEDLTGANPHPVHLVVPAAAPLSAVAMLGKQLFFDPSLSASGKQSCASCHSPQHAYGPPNDLSVQTGGPHMDQAGYRPPPSLTYLYRQAAFSIGPDLADSDAPVSLNDAAAAAQGVQRATKNAGAAPAAPALVPQGGLFWDGRANTLQDQAMGPMLNPVEMANRSLDEVAAKLEHSRYAPTLRQLFGDNLFADHSLAVAEAMFAISRYQFEDASFHAFTSKYDYWLQGKARLTHAELRGLKLFNDPDKANCAACHLSQPTKDGQPPLFTDTQYEALGVPRNRALPVNRNPKFYDLGVCGPFRSDLSTQTQYCAMFLTPTLRNAATRHVFFHNGVYHDLKQVVDFYNLRSTQPEKIYPHDASGHVQLYDDIPAQYRANVDVTDAPFDRKRGAQPALTDQDVQDVIAFLKTLDDGYRPSRPSRE